MASAIAFLSSCFSSSAYETLKTHPVFFNLHRFVHCVSRNKSSDFIFISQVFIPGRLKASLAGLNLQQPGLSTVWRNRISLNASAYRLNAVCSTSLESPDNVPIPIIAIVQDSDYDATIVKLSFGDRLGELNYMMKALLSLGLTVFKGAVSTEGSVKQSTFLIRSEFGHKVEDPDMLEKIRLTIIDTLLKYHPESCEQLAMGELYGVYGLKTQLLVDNAPVLQVNEDGPFRSLLYIEMVDRPGLLPDLIEMFGHMSFDAKSAKIVTEGFRAKFKIHVSYKGQSITSSMKMVLVNCLRYFLRVPETNIDSY